MRRLLIYAALTMALLGGAALAQQGPRGDEQVLTNASVVKLVRGGFSDKAVVTIINTRPTRFDLSTERLIELKKSRVSERVIIAMIARSSGGEVTAEDDWDIDSDPFFNDSARPRADRGANVPPGAAPVPGGETNIFGSSGGSRGRVRSRGNNGGVADDTETIGSASVRILRPPTEAGGGGASKLERTPTLTNESVAQLVEAGFSDGTIIRRIEQSPVEFELTEAKLAELRRRRVSEPVIAAMVAAMSEEPGPGTKAGRNP